MLPGLLVCLDGRLWGLSRSLSAPRPVSPVFLIKRSFLRWEEQLSRSRLSRDVTRPHRPLYVPSAPPQRASTLPDPCAGLDLMTVRRFGTISAWPTTTSSVAIRRSWQGSPVSTRSWALCIPFPFMRRSLPAVVSFILINIFQILITLYRHSPHA